MPKFGGFVMPYNDAVIFFASSNSAWNSMTIVDGFQKLQIKYQGFYSPSYASVHTIPVIIQSALPI